MDKAAAKGLTKTEIVAILAETERGVAGSADAGDGTEVVAGPVEDDIGTGAEGGNTGAKDDVTAVGDGAAGDDREIAADRHDAEVDGARVGQFDIAGRSDDHGGKVVAGGVKGDVI